MIDHITPSDFVERRKAGEDLLLLDVREPRELAVASVPGAVHIPMAQVPARLGELDRQKHIVVICHSGGRSQAVAGFLQHQGFEKVSNLAGGITRWSREVDPSIPVY
jgi:adenylyltransferase/sulfurtransferase